MTIFRSSSLVFIVKISDVRSGNFLKSCFKQNEILNMYMVIDLLYNILCAVFFILMLYIKITIYDICICLYNFFFTKTSKFPKLLKKNLYEIFAC